MCGGVLCLGGGGDCIGAVQLVNLYFDRNVECVRGGTMHNIFSYVCGGDFICGRLLGGKPIICGIHKPSAPKSYDDDGTSLIVLSGYMWSHTALTHTHTHIYYTTLVGFGLGRLGLDRLMVGWLVGWVPRAMLANVVVVRLLLALFVLAAVVVWFWLWCPA